MKTTFIILASLLLTGYGAAAQNELAISVPARVSDTVPMEIVKQVEPELIAAPQDTSAVTKAVAAGENADLKNDIIKTGLSFGPLPFVSVDAERGFCYGALLNIYNFGDGSNYPNPKSTWNFDVTIYTKGRKYFNITYDDLYMIPGVRSDFGLSLTTDNMLKFYGLNGYQTNYYAGSDDADPVQFYNMDRMVVAFKADFIGDFTENFHWEAGYHFTYTKAGDFTGTKDNAYDGNTLWGLYKSWGIIPEEEVKGGIGSEIRLGVMYDTRDYENNPSRGIWADFHARLSPKFLGSSVNYASLNATWRHYIPLYRDKLVFAYRLNYQQFLGDNAPWYASPYLSVVGPNSDNDGLGSYRTVRGIMANRIVGKGMGFYNAEMRYRFIDFHLFNQNWGLALSGYCDGAYVADRYDLTNKTGAYPELYKRYINTGVNDKLHISAGGGLRIILNRNFVVCAEFGHAFNRQDNDKSLTVDINTGWLF